MHSTRPGNLSKFEESTHYRKFILKFTNSLILGFLQKFLLGSLQSRLWNFLMVFWKDSSNCSFKKTPRSSLWDFPGFSIEILSTGSPSGDPSGNYAGVLSWNPVKTLPRVFGVHSCAYTKIKVQRKQKKNKCLHYHFVFDVLGKSNPTCDPMSNSDSNSPKISKVVKLKGICSPFLVLL